MARLLGRPAAALSQIAAVTTGELTAAAGEPAGGADQIIVNPSGFAKLSSLGRRVVITHETTHVAVRASTPRAVSIWLSEGFADYVGFSGLGLPRTEVAADVLGEVRRGIGPKHLPVESGLRPQPGHDRPVVLRVVAGLRAARRPLRRRRKLVALYRAASGATPTAGRDQRPVTRRGHQRRVRRRARRLRGVVHQDLAALPHHPLPAVRPAPVRRPRAARALRPARTGCRTPAC